MEKRIEQLFQKLGYTRENGLFYLTESDEWLHRFPYRISKVLKSIIQPYAFYSLHHHGDIDSEHPEPINNPIILFFDNPSEEKTKEIPKWSFCFSQAPIVIINNDNHDTIDIYHGYKFESDHNYTLQSIDVNIEVFSVINLTLGKTWKNLYHKYFKNVPKVDKFLLSNIIDARRILVAEDGYQLNPRIANRLIGRLLFVRYMIDRHVDFKGQDLLTGKTKQEKQLSLNQLLLDKSNLYKFFDYLTEKYQGDLFPLYEEKIDEETGELLTIYNEIDSVNNNHLEVLHHLFSCSNFFKSRGNYNGYTVQPSLFMVYDFEVIPVELISNIYENFIGKEDENSIVSLKKLNKQQSKQYSIKAYYTPPFIVDYILSQTVTPFIDSRSSSSCRVLDPSCGSGIFLVETLRKIIEKEIQLLGGGREKLTNIKLWKLLKDNIFGIDIDEDAIEITIFSLYITLLDYKTPIEIEHFKFERLKNENLFGGSEADFFNVDAKFNEVFSKKIALNFILGNPPWGKVKASKYEIYIEQRNVLEYKSATSPNGKFNSVLHPELDLQIGNKEISQAFLIRVSDFIQNETLKIGLVVTGKSLYNSDSTAKAWRSYFLSNFVLEQVLELSAVNNKIVGGNQIFEEAKMAPAILFYHLAKNEEEITKNVVTHITVKPNRFFNYFRTIVIEKHDIKKIQQTKFLEHDWIWKVMLHGNLLDYFFILRLKSYKSIAKVMEEFDLELKGGLKIKDGTTLKSTDVIKNFNFLNVEVKKEFQQFSITSSMTWNETVKDIRSRALKRKTQVSQRNTLNEAGDVGFLPDPYYFTGPKLLVKKGLSAEDNFKAAAAYSEGNLAFTATVGAIKRRLGSSLTNDVTTLLKSWAGIINSELFTYYILSTGSSAGIDRTRADFSEITAMPSAVSKELSELVMTIQKNYERQHSMWLQNLQAYEIKEAIERNYQNLQYLVASMFQVSPVEQTLIDYATEIALPILKRSEETGYGSRNIFRQLDITNEIDQLYLRKYATVFIDHFIHRFNSPERSFFVNIHIAEDFIGFRFIVAADTSFNQQITFYETDENKLFDEIGNLGIYQVTRDLYIQQDVRGFSKNTFYIIKPNEYKCWHQAVGHHDLLEFIDALASAETNNIKRTSV